MHPIAHSVFVLTDADEYTLSYMQRDPATFPAADLSKATAALVTACQGLSHTYIDTHMWLLRATG